MAASQSQPRFDTYYRRDLFECTGDFQKVYAEITAAVRAQFPDLNAEDLFFEKDDASLRMEMERMCNSNAPGDLGVLCACVCACACMFVCVDIDKNYCIPCLHIMETVDTTTAVGKCRHPAYWFCFIPNIIDYYQYL